MLNTHFTKMVAILLSFLIFTTSLLGQFKASDYLQGKKDGESDAKGEFYWFFSGCFLGAFGVVIPLIVEPSIPTWKLIGKSQEYIMGYTDGYKSTVKKKNAMYATIGCIIAGVVSIGLYIWAIVVTYQSPH
jgi:hypothetical protein